MRLTVYREDRTGVVVARRTGAPLSGVTFHIERGTRTASGCAWSGGLALSAEFRGDATQLEVARDDETCEALIEQGTNIDPAVLAHQGRRAASGTRTVINYSRWEDPVTIPLAGIHTQLTWTYSPTTVLSAAAPTDSPTYFRPTGWSTWTDHQLTAETHSDQAWANSAATFAGAQYFPSCHLKQVIATFRDNRVTGYPSGRWQATTDTQLTGASCRSQLHLTRNAIVN